MSKYRTGFSCVTLAVAFAIAACAPLRVHGQGKVPVWTLQSDLRIGGEADGPANFVQVRGIALTRTGNVFVLEYQSQELRVFDTKGAFLRRAGRRGGGPGELSNANGLAVGADGVVWMNDQGNGRFSLYRDDGTFLRQVVVPISGYGWVWRGSVISSDRIFDDLSIATPTAKMDPATGRPVMDYHMRFVSANGKTDTVAMTRCPGLPRTTSGSLVYRRPGQRGQSFLSLPFWPYQQTAYTRQSTVWCTPSDEYRLVVGPIGGTLHEAVRRVFPPVAVPDSERRREVARLDSAKSKYGELISGDPTAVPRTKPAIAQIAADDLGRVWVLRNGLPTGAPVLEVYEPSGRQVATVVSKGPIGEQVAIVGDFLLTVIMDPDDVPMVVRYRIVRGR